MLVEDTSPPRPEDSPGSHSHSQAQVKTSSPAGQLFHEVNCPHKKIERVAFLTNRFLKAECPWKGPWSFLAEGEATSASGGAFLPHRGASTIAYLVSSASAIFTSSSFIGFFSVASSIFSTPPASAIRSHCSHEGVQWQLTSSAQQRKSSLQASFTGFAS